MNALPPHSAVHRLNRTLPTALALAALVALPPGVPAAAVDAKAPVSSEAKPPAAEAAPAKAPARHPLKGIVLDIRADRSALIVKHEEIPGVMRAMTMLLKVDATTLAAAQKDQAITGLLVRKPDGWWLEEVKPAK
jgi:hypothetical protein